jgi:hypothetical protein
MEKLIGLLFIVIISVSFNSDRMRKVFEQDKFNGGLEYKLSGKEFREDLGNLVDNDKVSLGYSMDGKITGNTYSFFITFENPIVDLEDDKAVVQLTERLNPLIRKHISNLDKYGSYQVQFTKSVESENIERKQSVIITQEITTTKTDETK